MLFVVVVLHLRSAHKIIDTDNKEMHIPGLVPDIYTFLNFAFTVFFITLGFFFIMQCQCTDLADEEEDDFFDADGYFDVHLRYLNLRDRDRDSDTNTDTTDTDRYTDTDTDTDRDYYPIGPIPSAPPVRDFCLVCGDWSTKICSRCKVARYCSDACQINHWRETHKLVCKEYTSPGNIGSAGAGSSEGRSSRHRVNGVQTRTTQSSKKKSGKEHRSVVECPICLSAIRTYKHSRPSLSCEMCNQKFHSLCISKWLSTSKKSSCPCCLSPFQPAGSATAAGSATGQSSSSSK